MRFWLNFALVITVFADIKGAVLNANYSCDAREVSGKFKEPLSLERRNWIGGGKEKAPHDHHDLGCQKDDPADNSTYHKGDHNDYSSYNETAKGVEPGYNNSTDKGGDPGYNHLGEYEPDGGDHQGGELGEYEPDGGNGQDGEDGKAGEDSQENPVDTVGNN